MTGYLGLFASAFLAATLFPAASEALLGAMAASGDYSIGWLLVVASTGNTLGSVTNWLLGRYCLHWRERRWFPIKPAPLARASRWFARWGQWSLLFAWVPLVGDPLTLVAGILHTRFLPFLVLVAIGKTARYAVLLGVLRWATA